jgi:hypothetical protein|eukprot:COSAG02_NODE_1723_length_11188_cov_3.341510_10_plen_242_part_00
MWVVGGLLGVLVSSSLEVPPVGPDGSCEAFRALPEPTSLAAAETFSGVHPYVLRRRYVAAAAPVGASLSGGTERRPPCNVSSLSLENSVELLGLLDATASVSDLTAYAEDGAVELGRHTTLAQALERQDAGERLYYQTPLQLRSEAARRSQCGLTLPRHLQNDEWQACLGAELLDLLSVSRLSWLAIFVGVSPLPTCAHRACSVLQYRSVLGSVWCLKPTRAAWLTHSRQLRLVWPCIKIN